jgi:hypothetical protein
MSGNTGHCPDSDYREAAAILIEMAADLVERIDTDDRA